MSKCAIISDLHLFAKRSAADGIVPQLHESARRCDAVVLLGDIFDFKWSEHRSHEATADAAVKWLQDLLAQNDQGSLHYVLGNHDHHPALVGRLAELAQDESRFEWHPFHLRIGNAMFLHGDAANTGMNSSRLVNYRERSAAHGRPGKFRNRLYDWTVASKLHLLGARLAFPHRRVLRRITRYLDSLGANAESGVTDVFFGHTHRALRDFSFAGMRFHNCGAPIPGVKFDILEVDLSS